MEDLKEIFKQNEITKLHLIKGGDDDVIIDKRKMDKKKRGKQ
jgi:hypothetical protein